MKKETIKKDRNFKQQKLITKVEIIWSIEN